MMLAMAGLLPADADSATFAVQWFFLSAVVIGLSLGPIAARIHVSRRWHVLIWSSVLYFNIASVTIEGAFFAPDLLSNPWVILIQQLLICIFTGVLIAWLFAHVEENPTEHAPSVQRTWLSWTWRFLASAFSYLVFYAVFGALNFAFVTESYYAANPNLNVPDLQTILVAESIRAVLIVTSLLPFLIKASMPRRQLALWSGFLLFAIGGVVPLFWQIGNLPLFLLVASGWEILAQNFLTGVVAALLLAPTQRVRSDALLQRSAPLSV
jgi:hypothetical protein